MSESFNFRKPLTICFSVLAVTFILVGLLVAISQWSDAQEANKRSNRLYINNVASFLDKYLDGNENIVREMTRIAAEQHKFDKTKETDRSRRNWMIERLRIMPDALSIIHVDNEGHYIHLPYAPLSDDEENNGDPRKAPWLAISVNDSDAAHDSINRDLFDKKERVITISLPIINDADGENTGILALNLDVEKSKEILNTTLPPVKSRTFVMDREGELVVNPGDQIDPQTLKAIARNAREYRGDFVLNRHFYTYRTVGSQSWLVIHEVDERELDALAFQQCVSVIWGTLAALVVLLFCWWSTRAALSSRPFFITRLS